MNETPLTYARGEASFKWPVKSAYTDMFDHACELEQKLSVVESELASETRWAAQYKGERDAAIEKYEIVMKNIGDFVDTFKTPEQITILENFINTP